MCKILKYLALGIYLALGVACSPHKTIRIKTVRGGMATIPFWCSSWEDGCSVYCRVGPTGYREIPTHVRCIERNIIDPICADDKPEVQKLCGHSDNRSLDNFRDENNNSR